MVSSIKRSVCPYDCPDTCGLLVEVVNGRAVKVAGDPDHPFTRGFLCTKMNRYPDTVHSPYRLTRPLLRTGRKGSGKFRQISWPEAIFIISKRWREIIADAGAEAILPYSYAGTMGLVQRNAGHPFFTVWALPGWTGLYALRPKTQGLRPSWVTQQPRTRMMSRRATW